MSDLASEICDRYGSVYAFCKRSGLPRSTVYTVLRGIYPGNAERQTARIRAVLAGQTDQAQAVFLAIKAVACKRCGVRGPCSRCDGLFREQAAAVLEISHFG